MIDWPSFYAPSWVAVLALVVLFASVPLLTAWGIAKALAERAPRRIPGGTRPRPTARPTRPTPRRTAA
jgi:hypothetical protein